MTVNLTDNVQPAELKPQERAPLLSLTLRGF